MPGTRFSRQRHAINSIRTAVCMQTRAPFGRHTINSALSVVCIQTRAPFARNRVVKDRSYNCYCMQNLYLFFSHYFRRPRVFSRSIACGANKRAVWVDFAAYVFIPAELRDHSWSIKRRCADTFCQGVMARRGHKVLTEKPTTKSWFSFRN